MISRAFAELTNEIRFYFHVNKVILYLSKANFTRNMLFKLAKIIENEGLEDLIIPRLRA